MMDPCGTPVLISSLSDFVLSNSTYCFLSVKASFSFHKVIPKNTQMTT